MLIRTFHLCRNYLGFMLCVVTAADKGCSRESTGCQGYSRQIIRYKRD